MASEPLSDRESEYALRSWVLRREHADAMEAVAIAAPALDAMFALADGILEPLALGAEIGWFDLEHGDFQGYARPMEWRLTGRGSEDWPLPETLERVDRIDRAAADRFLSRATAHQPPAGSIACPFLLSFDAVRARVFEPVAEGIDRLRLLRDVGIGSLALERSAGGVWVSAPGEGFITQPIEIRARLDREKLEVQVDAHWTPWSEEDRPGTRAVEEAVARVAASGWEVEE